LSEKFLTLRRIQQNVIKTIHKMYSFVLLDRFFFQNSQISDFVKIRLLGAVLFYVDRQTDGQRYRQTDTTKSFWQFCESA